MVATPVTVPPGRDKLLCEWLRRCRPQGANRVWRSTAKVMGLVAATGLVVAACGGSGRHTSSRSTNSTSTTLAPGQQGAQVFQAKCANCHNARLAAQVTRDFPNVDDEITVVTNGRSGALETMPSFGGVLTPAQIRDVVEYTRTQLRK
jgi:mono/diheme cytochrome c family protein